MAPKKTDTDEPDRTLVKARYLGDIQVVMPHLADIEQPDREEAYAAWVEGGAEGLNPRCVVDPGDVIPLDRFSAEGRSDFEIVTARATKED